MTEPIVLFDGVCKFCNSSVNFLIDHDRTGRMRFAALQSDRGQALLERFGLPTDRINSLVVIEGRRCFVRSTAALRLTRYLTGLWPVFGVLLFVPAFLRDFAYDVLVSN